MSCHCHPDEHSHSSKHSCCGGGCGHSHKQKIIEISDQAVAFLMRLENTQVLPLARFVLTSTQSQHLECIALAPVYLVAPDESITHIKEIGMLLLGLQAQELITLDYDQPLQNCEYDVYESSSAYQIFSDSVREGRDREGFLFDLAKLEFGSISLTPLGHQALEQLKLV